MSALTELVETLKRIQSLIDGADTINQRNADASSYMRMLRVGFDEYGNQRVANSLKEWAIAINDKIRAELLAEIESRYAADLERRRLELESLRAIIPSLAAKASVEIGDAARSLRCDAKAEGRA